MAAERRSRNGCWTCRLRRKKCDERHPNCVQCQNLNITCYGFGERPDWMDGGEQEREELGAIKLAIVNNAACRQPRTKGPRTPLLLLSPSARTSRSPSPSLLQQDPKSDRLTSSAEDNNSNFEKVYFPPQSECGASAPTVHLQRPRKTSHDSGNRRGIDIQSMTLQDATLLMKFLDDTSWRTPFSFVNLGSHSRAWYLWLLSTSPSLYLTTLTLAACYDRRSDLGQESGDEDDEVAIRYGMALTELQRSMRDIHLLEQKETLVGELCILTCMLLLVVVNVLRGSNEWRIHLQAASSMIPRYFSADGELNIAGGSAEACDLSSAVTREVIGYVLWNDVLSYITVGTKPTLWQQYIAILENETSALRLEHASGCQNWVVLCLLRIYALWDWKNEAQATHSLSMWDFIQRASVIRQTLEAGVGAIAQQCLSDHEIAPVDEMQSSARFSWSDIEIGLVTYAFACAAAILLEVAVSGAYPSLPGVQRRVAGIANILTDEAIGMRSSRRVLSALCWPLCVSGCLAEPDYYHVFEEILSQHQMSDNSGMRNVLEVIRECWRLRGTKRGQNGCHWTDAMLSLGKEILFA